MTTLTTMYELLPHGESISSPMSFKDLNTGDLKVIKSYSEGSTMIHIVLDKSEYEYCVFEEVINLK